jgi:hypothetical protein
MEEINRNHKTMKVRQKESKLSFTVAGVDKIETARGILERFLDKYNDTGLKAQGAGEKVD